METSNTILSNAIYDEVISSRLAGVSDLIAAEGKYHLKCYTKFKRSVEKTKVVQDQESDPRGKCFEEVMESLDVGISRDNIYSLKSVWRYFCRKLKSLHLDPGIYRSNKLKEKGQSFLGDTVSFVQPLNPAKPLLIKSLESTPHWNLIQINQKWVG
jgi:hypothetical protein